MCREDAETIVSSLGNPADALERMLATHPNQKGSNRSTSPFCAAGIPENPIMFHSVKVGIQMSALSELPLPDYAWYMCKACGTLLSFTWRQCASG